MKNTPFRLIFVNSQTAEMSVMHFGTIPQVPTSQENKQMCVLNSCVDYEENQ